MEWLGQIPAQWEVRPLKYVVADLTVGVEIIEVIRQWQAGRGIREIARSTGIARNTVRKYVLAAQSCGVARDGLPPDEAQITALVQLGRAGPRCAWRTPIPDRWRRWTSANWG